MVRLQKNLQKIEKCIYLLPLNVTTIAKAMKNFLSIFAVCFTLLTTASAQDKAIGLRFNTGSISSSSSGSVSGLEISFQKELVNPNRVEIDLGFISDSDHNGLCIMGLYQWIWDLDELADGFNWYAGIGGGLRILKGFGAGINGQMGIEYNIPGIPLRLSLDTRPGLYLGSHKGLGYDAAITVRYLF